jgi:hypothetical protein
MSINIFCARMVYGWRAWAAGQPEPRRRQHYASEFRAVNVVAKQVFGQRRYQLRPGRDEGHFVADEVKPLISANNR